jgi:hypothetical protein
MFHPVEQAEAGSAIKCHKNIDICRKIQTLMDILELLEVSPGGTTL